jgi:alkaline phosphatase
MISTTSITDATPATFASHVVSRRLEENVALQEVDHNLRVVLGGGAQSYNSRKDGRNLLTELAGKGYTVVTDSASMKAASSSAPLIGLFAPYSMAYDIDRNTTNQPSLQEMVTKALEVLSSAPGAKENGFFLMVEAARIDHAGHNNDIAAQVGDVLAWNKAMGTAQAFLKSQPDGSTFIFSTSDHETGGLTLGGGTVVQQGTSMEAWTEGRSDHTPEAYLSSPVTVNFDKEHLLPIDPNYDYIYPYIWLPDVALTPLRTNEYIAAQLIEAMRATNPPATLQESAFRAVAEPLLRFVLSAVEYQICQAAMEQLVTRIWNASVTKSPSETYNSPYYLDYALNLIVSRRANVGWTTKAHSGIEVGVFAMGPQRELLAGTRQNSEHAGILAKVFGFDLAAASARWKSSDIGVCPYPITDPRCYQPPPSFANPPRWG